jgi:hypothetical protein
VKFGNHLRARRAIDIPLKGSRARGLIERARREREQLLQQIEESEKTIANSRKLIAVLMK